MANFDEIRQHLLSLGINIGFTFSGLFGSLLLWGDAKNWTQRVLSIFAGTVSATYLTPIVVDLSQIQIDGVEHGFAFVIGYSGLTVVEFLEHKYISKLKVKKDATNESKG